MAAARDRLMRLAVAIPAYDAVHSVGAVVTRTLALVPDVLVIDDGSSDGTADAARAAGAEVHRVRENRGKGAALREAFDILFCARLRRRGHPRRRRPAPARGDPSPARRRPSMPIWCSARAIICLPR